MEMEKMIELIDAVSKSDLTGFKYEEDGIKLHLSKKENTCYVTENVSAPVNMTGTASAATVSAGVVWSVRIIRRYNLPRIPVWSG